VHGVITQQSVLAHHSYNSSYSDRKHVKPNDIELLSLQ